MWLKGREQTMKKGLALVVMLMLAAMMLSGCNLIGYDAELDGAQVVAKVNDTEITKAEWLSYRDYMAAYEQQYYQQYFGFSMPLDEETLATYNEPALEQLIESVVVGDKIKELGFDPLPEEDAAAIEETADQMMDMYKMIMRYQNYPTVETVEEEQERLASATPSEATPAEPVATITDAQLDEMIMADLTAMGYTRENMINSETVSKQNELFKEHVYADVAITDDEVKAEFDSRVEGNKTNFDETPSNYAMYLKNGLDAYYVPAGYRGVRNLLIKISDEKETEISTLSSTLTTAQNALTTAQSELEELNAQDTSEYDEETLAAYNEQVAALQEQVVANEQTVTDTQAQIEEITAAAFSEIEEKAAEVLAKAQAGEDFAALLAEYGEDPGMTAEPEMTRGYLVCEGLGIYDQAFQDAAMALANVGDVSAELVKTSFGYHILQYTTDIESGVVEYTEEIKTALHDEMLTSAQEAAYEAAVTEWVSQAEKKTYPKVMK